MLRESVNQAKRMEIHTHYLKKPSFFFLSFSLSGFRKEGCVGGENMGDSGAEGVQTRVLENIISCHCGGLSERPKGPLHL